MDGPEFLNAGRLADPKLAAMSFRCLFKQVQQKTHTLRELRSVQLLTYSEAVKLNNEVDEAIRRLTALKKHLYIDRKEAYDQVTAQDPQTDPKSPTLNPESSAPETSTRNPQSGENPGSTCLHPGP